MYPKVEINVDNIINNLKKLRAIDGNKRSLTLVTKLLAGNLEVMEEICKKTNIESIADSHIQNLKTYNNLPVTKWLIHEPGISEISDAVKYADISFNSEIDIVRRLNDEAKKQNKIHGVLATYELGDRREGCNKEELLALVQECFKLENIKLYGIASNLSCLCGVIPSIENMNELKEVTKEIEEKTNTKMEIVTALNTSAVPLLKRNEVPEEINNLRIGEAVFCGYNTTFSEEIEGFNTNTFELKAEIVEIKNKPSKPNGTCLADFSGNIPKFEDKGIRKRAIVAIGNEDINITGITPKDDAISVVGGCSDYTVLDITESKEDYKVGDILAFKMNYVSILKAMISKFVEKDVI